MSAPEKIRQYTIDDLPSFSPWPARLLGLEAWNSRKKTELEVSREYEDEKWGALLRRVNCRATTLDEVENWLLSELPDSLCSHGSCLKLMSAAEARKLFICTVALVLQRYLPASGLVELGAGYGSVILQLARQQQFEGLPLFAGEYTPSGIELIRRLSTAEGRSIISGRCDLGSKWIIDFSVPEGALLLTSMAVHYVPYLSVDYVRGIAALKPSVVVNIEPCYEHFDSMTLTGALRRRYVEINDYNRNLVSLLHEQQAKGRLQILEELPSVLGVNPLLPVSVIAWSPLQTD